MKRSPYLLIEEVKDTEINHTISQAQSLPQLGSECSSKVLPSLEKPIVHGMGWEGTPPEPKHMRSPITVTIIITCPLGTRIQENKEVIQEEQIKSVPHIVSLGTSVREVHCMSKGGGNHASQIKYSR